MVKGLYVPANAAESVEAREFAKLEDYQAAVGGWIEPIDLPDLGVTVYVNEEGLVRGLPFNSRVTFLWWYHVPAARQSAMLVGDAVIVGLPDRNGDPTDLPAIVSELLADGARFAMEFRTASAKRWSRTERTYDYCDATVWAMLLVERSEGQVEVRLAGAS